MGERWRYYGGVGLTVVSVIGGTWDPHALWLGLPALLLLMWEVLRLQGARDGAKGGGEL